MYLPHTSVFNTRAYNSRHAVDAELKKAKDSVKTLIKMVAFLVVVNIFILCGFGGLVANTMTTPKNAENKDDALTSKNQLSHGTNLPADSTVQIGKLLSQWDVLADKQTNLASLLDTLEKTLTNTQINTSQQLVTLEEAQAKQMKSLTAINHSLEVIKENQTSTNIKLAEGLAATNLTVEIIKENQTNANGQLDILAAGLAATNRSVEVLKENHTNSAQQIAFTVHTPTGTLVDTTPTFKEVVLNIGDAYNTTSGRFRCPVQGLYLFTLTLVTTSSRSDDAVYCYIMYPDQNRVTEAISKEGRYDSASMTLFLHLSVGDVVYNNCGEWQFISKSHTTLYSGMLIKAD